MENKLNWEADWMEIRFRVSIFTIIGACAGLPALVWSVRELIHHRKNGHRISIFILLLLITDFVELFLSPYLLIKSLSNNLIWNEDWSLWVPWSLWSSSRACGLLFNQAVALEGILSVKDPLYTACVFSSPCFIILCIIVFLCNITWNNFLFPESYHFIFSLLVFIMSVMTWIISCVVSCSADRHSHTSRKPDRHIVVVFIFTLLVFYLPDILFSLLLSFTTVLSNLLPLGNIPSLLMSMRLISDPLLCVLVSRQNVRIKTSVNPEGTSLV